MKRIFPVLLGLIAAAGSFALASILAGSMIWVAGGAKRLDVRGEAKPVREAPEVRGWPFYGGDAGGGRYSSADEITRDNVRKLTVAWRYSTGDLKTKPKAIRDSAGETTPILVEDSLVFCTPFNEIIAVDPGTGAQKWRHDPKIDLDQRHANQFVCRGVAFWNGGGDGACATRIFSGTNEGRLIAVDARTGSPCADFAGDGDLAIDPGLELIWPGEFQITSPPVVLGDIVIIGSAIGDNARLEAPRGTVRAFNARTGAALWTFDPVPRSADEPNAKDWIGDHPRKEGHANVWAPMSVDAARGLIFAPTSSPSPDFFGGLRPGDNRYANSVVALEAETGKVRWSFQTVHHDVWDYDVPSQPGLYSILKDGKIIDVVAQTTKTGLVFVLDRDTGAPVIPVEERPVPQGGAPGEALSATQPFPVAPPPLVPTTVDPKDAFGVTWFDKRACAKAIRSLRAEGLYTPPTEQGTLFLPFTGGGGNWGGPAFDPARNLLVVNMSNFAHRIQLIPAADVESAKETYHDSEVSPQKGAPYGMRRDVLISPLGLPCNPPPWGVLAAVDLSDGRIVWRRTLGTTEELAGGLAFPVGTPTLGGPAITAGGVVFIGATLDHYLRAFDVETGKELWKGRLPTVGTATPMTYEWQGRQYVVIFAGCYANADTQPGDELAAFALPSTK
ncbi:MAG: pyrroloquinoline quinone-dependent dehydrogenase [Parvularculaceae bacterium]